MLKISILFTSLILLNLINSQNAFIILQKNNPQQNNAACIWIWRPTFFRKKFNLTTIATTQSTYTTTTAAEATTAILVAETDNGETATLPETATPPSESSTIELNE